MKFSAIIFAESQSAKAEAVGYSPHKCLNAPTELEAKYELAINSVALSDFLSPFLPINTRSISWVVSDKLSKNEAISASRFSPGL
jgi:hypothetical protein